MSPASVWCLAGIVSLIGSVLVSAGLSYALRRISTGLTDSSQAIRETALDQITRRLPVVGSIFGEALTRLAALKQSENDHKTKYKILTDNTAAAVMLHEADGTINWCSPFTEVITGFPLSAIYRERGSFLRTNVHEDDRELIERALAIVSTGEPFQCRYRFYHRSGMTLWLETRTVPIFDAESEQYVALSITLDVTANVMNQKQIEERNRDLHEFTYMISHDLKAPINTIKGMLGILEEDLNDQEKLRLEEPLRYVAKATTRLEQLVEGVLELAKISSTERSLDRVDTAAVLADVADDYKLAFADAQARLELPECPAATIGNRTQLYQIFSNLVGNALKYRDPARPLVVSITQSQPLSSRRVAFHIRDSGRGISADALELIFQPFNRAGEEAIEGTGVGLASVKRLIEKLGGSISVESLEGCGTVFTIEIRKAEV